MLLINCNAVDYVVLLLIKCDVVVDDLVMPPTLSWVK